MFLLLNEGLVMRMVKDPRHSTGVANASRITLAGAITKRQLRGTLDTNEPDRESPGRNLRAPAKSSLVAQGGGDAGAA